jgi:hypothetical protein
MGRGVTADADTSADRRGNQHRDGGTDGGPRDVVAAAGHPEALGRR